MTVKLLHHTPLWVCSHAIRTCWDSHSKSDTTLKPHTLIVSDINDEEYGYCTTEYGLYGVCGPEDKALIDRVGNKFKHASTLEHLVYTFYIQGISRALLQELSRHRIASLSVKSTRYTLKELKAEESFTCKDFERAKKYLVFTGDERVDCMSIKALENLRLILNEGISNDKAKYCLPESYKTELTWTINARSLQNFLSLRSSRSALREIRDLANTIFKALPSDHVYLFEDFVKE